MTNTLFVAKVYHHFDELASTNDYARELIAKNKPPEGTVIRADRQSAGRGQFGSHWLSAPGQNLTLSIIFYPVRLPATAQFRLSEAMALAVWDGAGPGGPERRIKWPNDIYLGSRKTAGILIQNTLNGSMLQNSVVGIGLNVNQMEFPPEVPNATSLALAFGQPFDLEALAEHLFESVERRYLQLQAGHTASIREEYHEHLLGRGEVRTFVRTADETTFTGIIQGVQDDGRLLVQTETGGTAAFDVKALRFVF